VQIGHPPWAELHAPEQFIDAEMALLVQLDQVR
jgi:hypothetical protein